MFRTLFVQEARTQLRRNAAVLGLGALLAAGFLVLWWFFARVPVLSSLLQMGMLVCLVGTPLVIGVQVAAEYWSSMYGRRGYLTMTLPVRGRALYLAKALYALLVGLAVTAAVVAEIVAWALVSALAMGADAATAWGRIADGFGAMGPGWALFMVAATVLMVANLVLEVFAVMSIGAEGRWNHLGFGAPMIGFVIVYIANQVVSMVSTVLIPFGIDSRTGSVQTRIMLPELIDAVRTGAEVTYVGMGALIAGPIMALLMAWWAIRSIEHRTSLR